MKLYYLHDGQVREGPFSLEELKERGYSQDTPVWHEGLTTWVPAASVEELRPFARPSIPPILPQAQGPSSAATAFTRINSKRIVKGLLFGLGFVVLTLAAIFLYNRIQQQKAEAALVEKASQEIQRRAKEKADESAREEARKAEVRNNIALYVRAEGSEYETDLLGGISDFEVTMHNTSEYLMDKVTVKVEYIKANGDVHRTTLLDFNLVQPHSSMTLPVESSSRGVEVKWGIVSIASKAVGL